MLLAKMIANHTGRSQVREDIEKRMLGHPCRTAVSGIGFLPPKAPPAVVVSNDLMNVPGKKAFWAFDPPCAHFRHPFVID